MTGKDSGPENGLDQRLQSLRSRLDERRGNAKQDTGRARSPGESNSGFARGLKMSSEFIAAILVGAGMGYVLDSFAGTAPWAMIVFLMLGFVAGVVNVLRSSGEMADPYREGWARAKGKGDTDLPAAGPDDKEE